MRVELSDGWIVAVPPAWLPRLAHGLVEQREQVFVSRRGLHREELDVSGDGVLAGRGDQARSGKTTKAA